MVSPISKARELCGRVVSSSFFEFFSGFVILLQLGETEFPPDNHRERPSSEKNRNLVAIGVEAEMSLQETLRHTGLPCGLQTTSEVILIC